MIIPDQIELWDKKHGDGDHEGLRHTPSPLAILVEPKFPKESLILELGCGVGRDAVFFAEKGHQVTATDSSKVVIKQDDEHFADSGVKFLTLDMQQRFPYDDRTLSVVYANLSLHYYSDSKTREIIKEITRVLKPNGIVAFACKSVDDFHHGSGEEVEKDIFVSSTGHVRHLFTISYAREILEDLFSIEHIDAIEEKYNNEQTNILRCIARKK